MNTVIDRFRAGHQNLRSPLDVFERQLRAFGQGKMPDMPLMRDILGCLNGYVAIGNDGYERKLMDELARTDRRFTPARLVLTTEHAVIAELGERCLALVEAVIAGTVLARTELTHPGQRYLRMYRTHLQRERSYLLRHGPETVDVPWGKRPVSLSHGPIADFPYLDDHIRQAAATEHADDTGQLVCSACAIDAAFDNVRLATPTVTT